MKKVKKNMKKKKHPKEENYFRPIYWTNKRCKVPQPKTNLRDHNQECGWMKKLMLCRCGPGDSPWYLRDTKNKVEKSVQKRNKKYNF